MAKNLDVAYYQKEKYYFDINTRKWVNLDLEIAQKDQKLEIIRLMMEASGNKFETENKNYNGQVIKWLQNKKTMRDIDTTKIHFKNGWFCLDLKMFIPHSPGQETPFTPFQIPYNFMTDPEVQTPEDKKALVNRFFDELSCGDEDFRKSILQVIGSAMAPVNDSIFPILKSTHKSAGKGTLIEILRSITGKTREIKANKWWGSENQFSLSSIKNALVGYIDEVPQNLPKSSSEKIKAYADSKKYLEIEEKNVNQGEIINSVLFIAMTNNDINFYSIDDSIKGRVIWYDLKMNSDGETKFTKKEIDTLINDTKCIQYIIALALEAYEDVLFSDGNRNERFTKPKCHYEFWEKIGHNSKALEVIECDEALSNLWDAKAEFYNNEDLQRALNKYRQQNPDEKITLMGVKNSMVEYINSNKLGKIEIGRHKGKRGVLIQWTNKN